MAPIDGHFKAVLSRFESRKCHLFLAIIVYIKQNTKRTSQSLKIKLERLPKIDSCRKSCFVSRFAWTPPQPTSAPDFISTYPGGKVNTNSWILVNEINHKLDTAREREANSSFHCCENLFRDARNLLKSYFWWSHHESSLTFPASSSGALSLRVDNYGAYIFGHSKLPIDAPGLARANCKLNVVRPNIKTSKFIFTIRAKIGLKLSARCSKFPCNLLLTLHCVIKEEPVYSNFPIKLTASRWKKIEFSREKHIESVLLRRRARN